MDVDRVCKECETKWTGGLDDNICPGCRSKNTRITWTDDIESNYSEKED